MKDLVILGAGGFAREVWWLSEEMNEDARRWNVLGFIDETAGTRGRILCDLPVLGSFDWFETRGEKPLVVCGAGSNRTRRRFVARTRALGLGHATLLHPGVRMSRFVEVGEGTVVCAGSVLTTQVRIGSFVNVNLGCTVGHDTVVEDFCNLSPGVHLSGAVHLERGVDVGTGAVVLPGLRVGGDSTLGAGAVVTADVPPRSVAVGVPARVVRTIEPEDPGD